MIVVVIVLIFVASTFMGHAYKSITDKKKLVITDLTQQCDIIPARNPEITNLQCCRDTDGSLTNLKYVPDFDMIVSPIPRPYLSVCAGFCLNGLSDDQRTCQSSSASGDNGQEKFNRCVSLTKPVDCAGVVKPVAYSGITRYYAYAAGEALCMEKAMCG